MLFSAGMLILIVKIAAAVVAIVLGLLLLDRLLLWMERKGWVYWRGTTRRTGPGTGNALLEMQTMFDPGARHVLEERQQEREDHEDAGDPPER